MRHFISRRLISRRRFLALGNIVLLLVTTAIFAGVFDNDFVKFDDDTYVVRNPQTLAGLSWTGFRYAFTTFDSGNWIPLTWLSYQLDVSLFGARPAGFHATNLALHCANVLLLFTWLVRVTGSHGRSLTVALLFAVHPLHVESVAWIAERKDVLSSFWLLVALLLYEKYACRPAAKWYLATCVAFMLGLLSKSMLVTLPLLLALIDVWPLARWSPAFPSAASALAIPKTAANGRVYPPRSGRQLLFEKLPLLAISLVDGIVTIVAQPKMSIASLSLSERIGNSLAGYGWYIVKTFWPTDLAVLYLHPLQDLAWGQVAASVLLLTAVSVYVVRAGLRRSHLLFGWLWYLTALLPVIGLVQVGTQAYADRYSYIPHMGLLVMIVWEFHYWLSRLPASQILAGATATIATAACGWLTMSQVLVWQSAETLFANALEVDAHNWIVHEMVGGLRLTNGQLDEAFEHYRLVLHERPGHSDALCNLAGIYLWRGERGLAENYYRRALESDAGHAVAINGLVALLKQQGRATEAVDILEGYLARRPDDARMHVELGLTYVRLGRDEPARAQFSAALGLDASDREARRQLQAVEQRLAGDPRGK